MLSDSKWRVLLEDPMLTLRKRKSSIISDGSFNVDPYVDSSTKVDELTDQRHSHQSSDDEEEIQRLLCPQILGQKCERFVSKAVIWVSKNLETMGHTQKPTWVWNRSDKCLEDIKYAIPHYDINLYYMFHNTTMLRPSEKPEWSQQI
ncbi:hypothetical protein K439DRAFT_1614478 [Ramaria rubella]|nr:hypothetical protein K439DRAFT_1614478 [Ramaria rubella]